MLTGGSEDSSISLTEAALLPESMGIFSNIFLHTTDVGFDCEVFSVLGLLKEPEGNKERLCAWRVTLISSSSSFTPMVSFALTYSYLA